MNNTAKNTLVGLTIASMIGFAGVAGFLSSATPAMAPVVQAAREPSASSVLPPPVTSAPAAVQKVSAEGPSLRPEAPSRSQSTTTSEVPAPLTPEQESKIPDAGHEGDAEFNTNPDLTEHIGQDYDLPYATTIAPEGTPAP